MRVFQKRNFKLLVDPIEQSISCFEQDGSRQKSRCNKEPRSRQAEPSFNYQTIRRYVSVKYFSRSIENDPFVQSITNDDVLANNIIRREH